jgi:hypothetical protein
VEVVTVVNVGRLRRRRLLGTVRWRDHCVHDLVLHVFEPWLQCLFRKVQLVVPIAIESDKNQVHVDRNLCEGRVTREASRIHWDLQARIKPRINFGRGHRKAGRRRKASTVRYGSFFRPL